MLPESAIYAVVGLLAIVENVFPPVPADTAVAVGAFVSTGGAVSASVVFLVTWVANVLGAVAVFFVARQLGRPFVRGPLGRRLMRPEALDRLERLHHRFGLLGIFLSRFIPGVRALMPPFAAVAGVPPMRFIVPTVLASGIWYGALTIVVVTFAEQIKDVLRWIDRVNQGAMILGIVIAIVVVVIVKRRRRDADERPG